MTTREFDVSLVMPCYNEEEAIGNTAPEMIRTFERNGVSLQLVLVDNGSRDRTGEILDGMVRSGYPIKKISFETNRGYGGGILGGLNACDAPIIGYLCADGQVAAEDALMAYRLILGREDRTLTKVRRRFRVDSWNRNFVSIIYNGLMQVLYGGVGAIDINGSPKIFSRKTFETMELSSRDWFLDPEIIIKSKYLGMRIIEVDVEGLSRRGGASNVNFWTCVEFVKNIALYRFGNALDEWRKKQNGKGRNSGAVQDMRSSALPLDSNGNDNPAHRSGENALPEGVRILTQKRYQDSRGFLQKVLTASQCGGDPPRGEVYVTAANPGSTKGNHYHRKMGEWFTVVAGTGWLDICHPTSLEKTSIPMGGPDPCTVYVPAGYAHSITNAGEDTLVCIAWAEKEHDPDDVYPFQVEHGQRSRCVSTLSERTQS